MSEEDKGSKQVRLSEEDKESKQVRLSEEDKESKQVRLSEEDKVELESYGITYSYDKSSSYETKDVVTWGYEDGNIIIFERNKKMADSV